MAGRIILDCCNPALDQNGEIDTGASLQFYENRTTTPQAIYADADLSATLDNPLSPDASGRFPEMWGPDAEVYTVEWTPTGESPITLNDIRVEAPNTYDLPFYLSGVPSDGESFPIFMVTRPLLLPQNLSESQFAIKGAAPTATSVVTLKKNGTSIGTLTYATDKSLVIVFNSDVSLDAGDAFEQVWPATADATMSNISGTFVFTVI